MAFGVVVRHGEVQRAVTIEIDPLNAMRGTAPGELRREHIPEMAPLVVIQIVALVDRSVDVGRHIEVRAAVVVIVAPARWRGFIAARDASLRSHIREFPAAMVVVRPTPRPWYRSGR